MCSVSNWGGVIFTAHTNATAESNPWRFSSEFAEDDTATVYYNYRHYEPLTGRWTSRDPIFVLDNWPLYFYMNLDIGWGLFTRDRSWSPRKDQLSILPPTTR